MTTDNHTGYVCAFCQKEFRKESSMEVHMCEPKRRWRERDERGVQLGLMAYLKFYEYQQGSARLKTFEDFAASNYYRAFVKFGRYCVNTRVINPLLFMEWLLKNNRRIDYWCRDSDYGEWLNEYIRVESVQDALERGMREIQDYADGNSGLASFSHYFRYGNSNRICYHISTGRVSPWIIYNCDSGRDWLGDLNQDGLAIVLPFVDPDFWNRKFESFPADVEWCRHILKEAGF